MAAKWSSWRHFPDPRIGGLLTVPFGPGCYELRLIGDRRLILYGRGGHVAKRMSSLLPSPLGTGTRNNAKKRDFVLAHLGEVEYRTLACDDVAHSCAEEATLQARKCDYIFPT